MKHAPGNDGVPLAVDLLELHLAEALALGRARIDAERVVTRVEQARDEPAVGAAAHLEHATWRRRQLVEYEGAEIAHYRQPRRDPPPRGGGTALCGACAHRYRGGGTRGGAARPLHPPRFRLDGRAQPPHRARGADRRVSGGGGVAARAPPPTPCGLGARSGPAAARGL